MNAIVTTTINEPTEALIKFSKKKNWKLYVVADLKTPAKTFKKIKCNFLDINYQNEKYKDLSDLIGWNCIQRRNIGFVEAYLDNAEIIASVDDDNIPFDDWGENLLINKKIKVDCYENKFNFFDPLSITNVNFMWHRGYPIQLVEHRKENKYCGKIQIKPLIQADMWDGDPDVDAICRLMFNRKNEKIKANFPYTTKSKTIFNSQNTFFHRSILKNYFVIPKCDRMDDIWGSLFLQEKLKKKPPYIVFNKSSVFQKRNYHNIVNDLEREISGHYKTIDIFENNIKEIISTDIEKFIVCYSKYFNKHFSKSK